MDNLIQYDVRPAYYENRGKVSSKSLNEGLVTLNNIRFIAGLDPVSINSSYTDPAQAAAFVNAVIGEVPYFRYYSQLIYDT